MVNRISAQSLILIPSVNGIELSTATGFVVHHDGKNFLITNWHVVAGRNPETGQPISSSGATPDSLTILHLQEQDPARGVIEWKPYVEPLFDDNDNPLWLEHPEFRRRVDVVALQLTKTEGAQIMPHSIKINNDQHLPADVSDWVNIVGFPFGVSSGGALAIWTKGAIASDRDIHFGGLPCFLIDARTRQGQSGSPVITYSSGGPTAMAGGGLVIGGGPIVNLLGVYSGRINEQSDLGKVWKIEALIEVIENGVAGNGNLRPSR